MLEESGSIEFYFGKIRKVKVLWHSSAHLFAQIVKELYPKIKVDDRTTNRKWILL